MSDIEIPWTQISMIVIALAVLASVVQLASWGIAPWDNVFTIILIILTGFGFLSAGTAYGEAKAYRAIYRQLAEVQKEPAKA